MTLDNQAQPQPSTQPPFFDRRDPTVQRVSPGLERRQFSDARDHLSDEAAELGSAIDQYKLVNRRRFISYEEMLSVIKSLGYEKPLAKPPEEPSV